MIKDYFEDKAEEVLERMEKTPAQKLIIVLLALISVGVVGLGFLQFKNRLEGPFLADRLIEEKARIRGPLEFLEFYRQEQRNNDELTRLQQRDSDGDGLTDYQEIYIYKSNAYSADSDGDGEDDGVEIAQGTDPNCRPGEICDEDGFVVRASQSTGRELDLGALVQETRESYQQLQGFNEEEKEQLRVYFESLEPQDLRQLLEQQGFPLEDLEGLTNEELQQTLNAILEQL